LPLDKKQFLPRLGFAYFCGPEDRSPGRIRNFLHPEYVSFGTISLRRPVSSATSKFLASNDGWNHSGSRLDDSGSGATATVASGCTLSGGVLTCYRGPAHSSREPVLTPGAGPQSAVPNTASSTGLAPCDISQYISSSRTFSATVTLFKSMVRLNREFRHQRELPAGFFCYVAYAGSHGVHLPALTPTSTDPGQGSSLGCLQYDESACYVCESRRIPASVTMPTTRLDGKSYLLRLSLQTSSGIPLLEHWAQGN